MSQAGGGAQHGDDWGPEEPTPWEQGPDEPNPWTEGSREQAPPGPLPAVLPNYLVHSILATVLCCLPTGVVGIVYAAQVNGKLAAGDLAGAQAASQKARLWTIISVVVGLSAVTLYLLAYAASV